MEKMLKQDEIDALFEAARSSAPIRPDVQDRVVPYNFSSSGQISKDQLRAISMLNDMFARNARIRADGRMVHDMYLVQVKAPTDVKEKWDYYNVKETIPGDEAFQPLTTSKCRLVAQ